MKVVLKVGWCTLSATNATYHLLFITFAWSFSRDYLCYASGNLSSSRIKCHQWVKEKMHSEVYWITLRSSVKRTGRGSPFLKAKRYLLSFGLPLCPWEDLLSCVDQQMTTTNVTHKTMDSDSDGGEDLQVSTLDPKATTSYKQGSTAVVRRDSSGYYSDTQKRSPRYRVNQTQSHLWLLRTLHWLLEGHYTLQVAIFSIYLPVLQLITLKFGLIPGSACIWSLCLNFEFYLNFFGKVGTSAI